MTFRTCLQPAGRYAQSFYGNPVSAEQQKVYPGVAQFRITATYSIAAFWQTKNLSVITHHITIILHEEK